MRPRILWRASLGLVLGAGLAATVAGLSASRSTTDTADPAGPDLARGAAIYAEACASCHGADLQGQPNWQAPGPDGRMPAPPHDRTGHTWHHPDRVLLAITRLGTAAVVGGGYESNMPGFGGQYSDAELRDVIDWIKAQWPERERAVQAKITAEDEIE